MSIDTTPAPELGPGQGLAPVVFLDFDGVTHPELCRSDQMFTCLPLIEEVLRQHERAELVISSSWREHHPLSELREFFAEDIAPRVVGTTPVAPEKRARPGPAGVRHIECLTWLIVHRQDHPWIAIDDVPWLFPPGCPNLLLTHHRIGFTPANAAHLHSVLRRLSS